MPTKTLKSRILELCNSYGTVIVKNNIVYVEGITGEPDTKLLFTNPQYESFVQGKNKYSAIITRFDLASARLQYPKMYVFDAIYSAEYKLYRAGERATFPGSIQIIDTNRNWHGRIMRDGKLQLSSKLPDWQKDSIKNMLDAIVKNPNLTARMYAKRTNNCMFCRRTLTENSSVALGYGPICAGTYGLPHGQNDTMTTPLDKEVSEVFTEV